MTGLNIQGAEHSSIEDARAAMALYRMFRVKWEKDLRDRFLKNRGIKRKMKEKGEEEEREEEEEEEGEEDQVPPAKTKKEKKKPPRNSRSLKKKRLV